MLAMGVILGTFCADALLAMLDPRLRDRRA